MIKNSIYCPVQRLEKIREQEPLETFDCLTGVFLNTQ